METRATYDSDKKVYKLNGSKTWLVFLDTLPFFRVEVRLSNLVQDHKLAYRRRVSSLGEM